MGPFLPSREPQTPGIPPSSLKKGDCKEIGTPPAPVVQKPSVSTPIKRSTKQGNARGTSEVRRGTSSNHFHCPVPWSSSHIGHGFLTVGTFFGTFSGSGKLLRETLLRLFRGGGGLQIAGEIPSKIAFPASSLPHTSHTPALQSIHSRICRL